MYIMINCTPLLGGILNFSAIHSSAICGSKITGQMQHLLILQIILIFLRLLTPIFSYFDPQELYSPTIPPKVVYNVTFYHYIHIYVKLDNLPYLSIFKGFSIFLGYFTSIYSYFDPQIALKSQNIPNSGG